jgi:hypothetical protein
MKVHAHRAGKQGHEDMRNGIKSAG